MNHLPDPLAFSAAALEARGALVERSSGGALAILPAQVAGELGLPEEARLSPDDTPGTIACGVGAPLLDRLVEWGRAEVPVAHLELSVEPPRHSQVLAAAARFGARNGVTDMTGVLPAKATYVAAWLAYTGEADDRYEGVFQVAFEVGSGGFPDPAWLDLLDVRRSDARASAAGAASIPADAGERLSAIAADEARRHVREAAASVARRRERERARILDYFAALIGEAAAPRRQVSPEAIATKVAHLHSEQRAKLAALDERYRLRVNVRVAAVVIARVPASRVQLRLRRRKRARDVELVLPGGTRQLDQAPCDACPGATSHPVLCDDALHLLCERCAPTATGRPACRACRGAIRCKATHPPA